MAKNYYWAYIHRENRSAITVKQCFFDAAGKSDLAYAIEEQLEGNDFFWAICDELIEIEYKELAYEKAAQWFLSNGYCVNVNNKLGVQWDISSTPIRRNRFANLIIE